MLLGDDLWVAITVDPYPAVGLSAPVELDLYLFDALGNPVVAAEVRVRYDMLLMAHGPFELAPAEIAAGHHRVTLDLLMFGAWGVEVTILVAGETEPAVLQLIVVLALPSD